jgi:hypothetical protein
MIRTNSEIAARAMIYGVVGFRASLEVTVHARTVEICSRLLPWLEELGIGPQIESVHREILECPHGSLPSDLKPEAYWRGESAELLGWSIQLFEKPDRRTPVNPNLLLSNLKILRPEARDLLHGAALRPMQDVFDFCGFRMEVTHQFRLLRMKPDDQVIFESIHQKVLQEKGLNEIATRRQDFQEEASVLASTESGLSALYVVRSLAAEWLLAEKEIDESESTE